MYSKVLNKFQKSNKQLFRICLGPKRKKSLFMNSKIVQHDKLKREMIKIQVETGWDIGGNRNYIYALINVA